MAENTSVKLAFHKPTQQVIHIDKASNGLSCNCECVECKETLEAIQGDVRDWHFRHSNKNCRGGLETALHQLGKQILIENQQLSIPGHGTIQYSDPVAEKGFYSTRPDVTATHNKEKIYFEIAVKHFIEQDKEAFFTTGQYKCVEIDLSNADITSLKNIEYLVLSEISNKKLFGWGESKQGIDNSWIGKLTIGVLIFLFGRWLFRRRKR